MKVSNSDKHSSLQLYDINYDRKKIIQVGQPYWAFPFSKASLVKVSNSDKHSSLQLYDINYGCKKDL